MGKGAPIFIVDCTRSNKVSSGECRWIFALPELLFRLDTTELRHSLTVRSVRQVSVNADNLIQFLSSARVCDFTPINVHEVPFASD